MRELIERLLKVVKEDYGTSEPTSAPVQAPVDNLPAEETPAENPEAENTEEAPAPDAGFEVTDELLASLQAENPDLANVDIEQLRIGLQTEQEHADVTGGDPAITAKIAAAHLKEIPDYYARLTAMEAEAQEEVTAGPDNLAHEENETPAEEEAEQAPGGEEEEINRNQPPMESKKAEEGKIPADPANCEGDIKTLQEDEQTAQKPVEAPGDKKVLSSDKDQDITPSPAAPAPSAKAGITADKQTPVAPGLKQETLPGKTAPGDQKAKTEPAPVAAAAKAGEGDLGKTSTVEAKEPKESEEAEARKSANKAAEDKINKEAANKK